MAAVTVPALLAAALRDPAADAPRLAYADWLDRAGEGAHADFVRLQLEAAAARDCPDWCDHDPARCAAAARDVRIESYLRAHGEAWVPALRKYKLVRVFPPDVPGGFRSYHHRGYARGFHVDGHFVRGLVGRVVLGRAVDLTATVATRLGATCPLDAGGVVLADRVPIRPPGRDGRTRYVWTRVLRRAHLPGLGPHDIPAAVFDHLYPPGAYRLVAAYPDPAAALAALATATANYCRRLAGYPPLPGPEPPLKLGRTTQ